MGTCNKCDGSSLNEDMEVCNPGIGVGETFKLLVEW